MKPASQEVEGTGIDHRPEDSYRVYSRNIAPGIGLTCLRTEKFKTGCLSMALVTELSKKTASKSALTPRVLRRGSAGYPDMRSISEALDGNYGARIEPAVRKKGELQCIGFYADFTDDRFIPDADTLEKTTSLLGDILLSPNLYENSFREDYTLRERSNLIDDIRAVINDKRGYSVHRLLEEMCSEEAFGVSSLGSEDEARGITPEALTAHYRGILAKSAVHVFYCGSAHPERVESALIPILDKLPRDAGISIPETIPVLHPASGAPRRFTEELDVAQGKLAIGFRLGKAIVDAPNYPALMVLNAVYGSGDMSKLFQNVREKLSLCYSVGSSIDRHKGVMVVTAGVDPQNCGIATDEILAQLSHVKNGDISEQELVSAKRAVVTSLKLAMDRPGGLGELYFDSYISKVPYDPCGLCGSVEAVTIDDVLVSASDVCLDSTFFLTGYNGGAPSGA